MTALAAQQVDADAQMRFNGAGVENWLVAISPTEVLSGTQLAQLSAYCASKGLAMTATFSQLGIV